MPNTLQLDGELSEIITDLAIEEGRHKPSAPAECGRLLVRLLDDESKVVTLRAGLERALARREYFALLLEHYDRVLERPSRRQEFLDDDLVERVRADGLEVLTTEQLATLAVAPQQLVDLWDALSEQGLSPYWKGVLEWALALEEQETGRHWPTLDELKQSHTPAAAAKRELAAASLDQPGPSGQLQALRRWPQSVKLDQAQWKQIDNADVAAALRDKEVGLDFTWRAGDPAVLEVRFVQGPLALAGAICLARLEDQNQVVVKEGTMKHGKLIFVLGQATLADLGALTLVCDFQRPGVYRVVFQVPLQPHA